MKGTLIKRIFHTGMVLVFISACQSNKTPRMRSTVFEEGQHLMQADKYARNHPDMTYDTLPNTSYILPMEMSSAKNKSENYKAQLAFFDQAIPFNGMKLLEWENGMTWQIADSIYRKFVIRHEKNQYINPFREHGSYEILVRLGLLSDTGTVGLKAIHFYLKQLIKAQSLNTPLIYYGLSVLEDHYPENELKELAKEAVHIFEKSKRRNLYKSQFKQLKEMYNRNDSDEKLKALISKTQLNFHKSLKYKKRLEKFASDK